MDSFDVYYPSFLALAALYIVIDITKYMAELCGVRKNDLREIAANLYEINKKVQSLPFEAVCLCEVCAPAAAASASAVEKRRPSVAALLSVQNTEAKIEHVAIGISDSELN